ncbi:MAG: nodulation protein NfeD, partial [Candidatus Firestonebacteria bacterium]
NLFQHIMNSNVPVVVYIYPNGARAASAGVFIALAADIVAMSPGTNIGAAHPVDLSGKSASEKITNDAVAYIKAIAQKKHRNISWAEKAVKESVSITETEAVKLKISDWTSSSIDELLTKINGKKIILSNNETKIIDTKGSRIRHIKMNNIEKFLNAISDPNIAYVLFMLGIYGLIYELASPGTLFSGIVGVICIILALTAFESLPINLAGLLLILLAILLFFLDIKAPTHGILTIGGIIALTLGSFMLFVPSLPEYRVSTSIVVTMVILTSGFFTFAIAKGILAQKSKVMSGWESLIGKEGDARSDIAPEGRVYVAGEEWTAYIEGGTITKGEKIKVIGINGVKLKVEKAG